MRKFIVTLGVLAIVVLATYFGLLIASNSQNDEAENAISKYVVELNNYKAINGKYPVTLEGINIHRKRIFYLVAPLTINFVAGEDASLYYNQFPLGPKHVYNLGMEAWSFEE